MAQTDIQTDGHGDSMTESAQWADSVKITRKYTLSERIYHQSCFQVFHCQVIENVVYLNCGITLHLNLWVTFSIVAMFNVTYTFLC